MPDEAREDRGTLSVDQAAMSDAGNYVCSARDPHSDDPVDSMPALVNVKPAEPSELSFLEFCLVFSRPHSLPVPY